MPNKKHFPIILFIGVFALVSCGHDKDTNASLNKPPFDYNKRNIYVFSVKALNNDNKLLYTDTLGLMCTNKIWSADSNQKTISWVYLAGTGPGVYGLNTAKGNNTITGMMSSRAELFLHPQRIDQYTILETCPFPSLHFPLFIGKKWNWDLNVSSRYCPSDTIRWKGDKTFKFEYEVADTSLVEIPSGKISCYRIHAVSSSTLGTSSADFYYSYQYGLVKLYYLPLDNTKIEFNFQQSVNDLNLFRSMFPRVRFGNDALDYLLK